MAQINSQKTASQVMLGNMKPNQRLQNVAKSGSYVPYVDGQTSAQVMFSSSSSSPTARVEVMKPSVQYIDRVDDVIVRDKPFYYPPVSTDCAADSY